MHVVIFPSWYTTPANPIRGSMFREAGLALQRRGHQIGVFVPPSKFRTYHGLDELRRYWHKSNKDIDISEDNGLNVYRMHWWGWLPSLMPPLRRKLALEIFDRYCRKHGKPDVLHARSILYGGYLAAYIGQVRNIPVVLTEHSSNYIMRSLFLDQTWRAQDTLRHVDRIYTVGAPLAEALKAQYGNDLQIEVLTNSVDTFFFTPSNQSLVPSPFTFLTVSRLDKNKAVDLLLQAFAKAFKGQDVQLVVIGDGVERNKLEELAISLGLDEHVKFLGQQSRVSVRDWLQNSHALVSSSYVETFGNTLIEALACGKPVISTRSGGPDSIVTDTTGLLVPTGDVDALAQTMREMVENYSRYDAEKIRAECVARFSEDAITTQLESIYNELINSR